MNIPLQYKDSLLIILGERARQVRQSLSRLSSPSFGEKNRSGWGSETRSSDEPKDFSVVVKKNSITLVDFGEC